MELSDPYFLFYDLFLLFQEEDLEKLFLAELEPLIVSGAFKDWLLPVDVLQHHIIEAYGKHFPPATLEKVIINLNVAPCTDSVMKNLVDLCKDNGLTTALLYLGTSQPTSKKEAIDTSCLVLLNAMF
mmetsp:Transcript_29960/g.29154  ORF Transcript_29960/g.29154 Transcript_29960/m.29154 type:complete len:127 (-) Transcript_29960:207-587(-)